MRTPCAPLWVRGLNGEGGVRRPRAPVRPDLGRAAFGPRGAAVLEALQIASFVLTGVAQTQGAGSAWQQALPEVPLCASQWVLLNALPYLLFLQIPSFAGSGMLRVASVLAVVLTLWRVGLYLVLLAAWGRYPYICYTGQTSTSILSAAANLMFTFGVKNTMPETGVKQSDCTGVRRGGRIA